MQILLQYIKKYKWSIVLSLVLATINQVFSLLDPWVFRKIIDNYATKPDLYSKPEFVQGVGMLLLLAIGVAFVSRVAKNFQDYFVNRSVQKIGTDIYVSGIEHTLSMPYAEFEDEQSGSTLSKIQKVRTDTEKLLTILINNLFVSLVGFVFVFIYAASVYWPITILFVIALPLIAGVSFLLSKKIKKVQTEIVCESNALAGSTTETLRNIELVKSLGLGEREVQRLKNNSLSILGLELKKVKYLRSLSFIQGTIVNLVRTVMLGAMLYFIFDGKITFGEFFSLWIYSFYLFTPLQDIGNVITSWREAEVSLLNYKNIMDLPKEENPVNPEKITKVDSITVSHVSFAHKNSSNEAITDVNFSVKTGETIAFVGPSGSGKSTLIKLISGLYLPNSGNIEYNGVNMNFYDKDSIRNTMGIVTQDTQLFSGTLLENIQFANVNATIDDCQRALYEAAADSIIERSQNGIYTKIGENGIKLSGGEKQRIAIARALVRAPQILIFDEATSALDSITEESITSAIKSLNKDSRITVLVAHRLSTVMHADRIYVLKKGSIVESGNHDELIHKNGLYNALWKEQGY
jgi:ATP-binding cassette subfamily B protein